MQQGNTKERIVEAYIELESERPLEKITVTALVERSRITRKTFYYYFKDIYDLMEYRMEREMKRVMEETISRIRRRRWHSFICISWKIRSISGHCLSQHSSWRCAVRWEKRCTSIFITIWSGLVCSRS